MIDEPHFVQPERPLPEAFRETLCMRYAIRLLVVLSGTFMQSCVYSEFNRGEFHASGGVNSIGSVREASISRAQASTAMKTLIFLGALHLEWNVGKA
jgi:hypothetical protein